MELEELAVVPEDLLLAAASPWEQKEQHGLG
jgi:hypothetical protein